MTKIEKKTGKHEFACPSILDVHNTYTSEKGKISLISLPNYFRDGLTVWEIYCLEGNLFEDTPRFNSLEEAEEEIERYFDLPKGRIKKVSKYRKIRVG